MTNESGRVSLPQSDIELLCLFSHNLSACISPTLGDGLQTGSNTKANGTQLLFVGCLPPIQSLLMGNILINLTGLLCSDNNKHFLRRLQNYLFQPASTLCHSKPARKSFFSQTKLLTLLSNSLIICLHDQQTIRPQRRDHNESQKEHVGELMNVGRRDYVCRDK